MTNPRILIAVPTYGQNDSRFTTTMFMLAKLRGTDLLQVRRSMPDIARNKLAEQALEMKYDFLFFLDDDMVIQDGHPAALLDKLLADLMEDPGLSIVAPRAYQRTPPFTPCVFRRRPDGTYDAVEDVSGLVQVDAIHCAATLIRMSVFEKLPKPWFEFMTVNGLRLGEDLSFTRKVREAGMGIACRADLQVQHLSEPTMVDQQTWMAYKAMTQPKPQLIRP